MHQQCPILYIFSKTGSTDRIENIENVVYLPICPHLPIVDLPISDQNYSNLFKLSLFEVIAIALSSIIYPYVLSCPMLTPDDFLEATKWGGIATLVFAALTALAFVFSLGIRFRLVGVTGFLAVLAAGCFGLSLEPFTRTQIPGAIPYTTVYDSGSIQVVIKVPAQITEPELKATLRQAASNLFKAGRLGSAGQAPTIRARTLLHEGPGVTRPLYLGQVQPIPDPETGEPLSIEIFRDHLAQIPKNNEKI